MSEYNEYADEPYDRESDVPTRVIPPEDIVEDETPDDSPVQPFHPGADFSIIDTFKQELQELVSAESVLIPVKGYEQTGLQIKYRMPDSGKELETLGRNVMRQQKDAYNRNLMISMDTMIYLCEGLYVQPEGVEEPVMLDPDNTGAPCQFDHTLATMMGMNGAPESPRAILKRLFGGNDLAIINHAERLNRWLQNTKADLNAEIWQLGE